MEPRKQRKDGLIGLPKGKANCLTSKDAVLTNDGNQPHGIYEGMVWTKDATKVYDSTR